MQMYTGSATAAITTRAVHAGATTTVTMPAMDAATMMIASSVAARTSVSITGVLKTTMTAATTAAGTMAAETRTFMETFTATAMAGIKLKEAEIKKLVLGLCF